MVFTVVEGLWFGQHGGAVVRAVDAVCHLVWRQSQRLCWIQTATLHQRRHSYCLSLHLVCSLCRTSQQCPKSVNRDIQPQSTHSTTVFPLLFTQQQMENTGVSLRRLKTLQYACQASSQWHWLIIWSVENSCRRGCDAFQWTDVIV